MKFRKAVAAACCEGTLVYTLLETDLDRCESIGLSATLWITATSPSNLALPVHRPHNTYDANIFYVTRRVQTISAPQSLSEPDSHTNDIVDRMEECRCLVPGEC